MLANTSVRFKLNAALAILLCVTVFLGSISYLRIVKLIVVAGNVGDVWLPSTRSLGGIGQIFEKLRSQEIEILLLAPADQAVLRPKIDATLRDLSHALKEYELGDRQNLQDAAWSIRERIPDYLEDHESFIKRLSADRQAATAFLLRDMGATLDGAQTAIRDALNANARNGQEAAARAALLGRDTTRLIVCMIALAIVLSLVVGWMCVRTVSTPITLMANTMRTLSNGVTDLLIPCVGERSEIGAMAGAVEVFRKNIIRTRHLEREAADARLAAAARKKLELSELAANFNHAIGGIAAIVTQAATQLQSTSLHLTSTARSTQDQAHLAEGAASQAGDIVSSVADATRQFATLATEITDQVRRSSATADAAVAEARASAEVIQGLNAAVRKIGDVVAVIANIATQTNYLALNATIEAATSGEAGHGFAVVAIEVKTLAERTSGATVEIREQVERVCTSMDQGMMTISNICEKIEKLIGAMATISASVQDHNAAAHQAVALIQNAVADIERAASGAANVAVAVSETGLASTNVLDAASSLSIQAQRLRAEVDTFLRGIEVDGEARMSDAVGASHRV